MKPLIESQLPLRVEEVDQYWGSFVKLGGRTPNGSQAHLRIYLCDWELVLGDEVLATEEGTVEGNRSGLGQLLGVCLVTLSFAADRRRVRLTFDSGHVLTLFANEDCTSDFFASPDHGRGGVVPRVVQ